MEKAATTINIGLVCEEKYPVSLRMLMQALGFNLEHKRPDRNLYMKINQDNVLNPSDVR